MPNYKVFFRFVNKRGVVKRDHVQLDAQNMADAKSRVIRGEKPTLIAVDRVKRL